jgi:dipeptidyl-peptidase-3
LQPCFTAIWVSNTILQLTISGNYKSFGDTKFIPRIERDALNKIVQNSGNGEAIRLFEACADSLYSVNEEELEIGFHKTSTCSGYYNKNVTKEDAELVQAFLEQQHISAYNTRVFKTENGFDVLLASASVLPSKEHDFRGVKIRVVYGDYQKVRSKFQVSHLLGNVSNCRKS